VIYKTTTLSDGFYLYHRKLIKSQEERKSQVELKVRLTLMQMDWIAGVMTGKQTKLVEEFENSSSRNSSSSKNESKSKKKKKLSKVDMKKAIEAEERLIEQLAGHFGPSKKKK
jgi:hypothetical protein